MPLSGYTPFKILPIWLTVGASVLIWLSLFMCSQGSRWSNRYSWIKLCTDEDDEHRGGEQDKEIQPQAETARTAGDHQGSQGQIEHAIRFHLLFASGWALETVPPSVCLFL